MKSVFRKITSVILIALVVLSCVGLLIACNDDKDKKRAELDAKERTESVNFVKSAILSAIDENWGGALDDAAIIELPDAGDYIVTEGWANMICDVLKSSALQTGKLKSLKEAVDSDDGKKLLANFNENFALIIPVMQKASFTPTDISNLFYDLLCALVRDGGNTIKNMRGRLSLLKSAENISNEARDNVLKNDLNLELIETSIVPSEREKTDMLSAFEKAKEPMSALVSFAYNSSVGVINDGIFDALFSDSGALTDITDGEIRTVLSSLTRSLTDLKDALDDEAVENLNVAMKLVIDKFDTDKAFSPLYQQVVTYAKYGYRYVDIVPAFCDMASSAGKLFDDVSLLGDLRDIAETQLGNNARNANAYVLINRVLLQIANDYEGKQEQLKTLVDKLGAHCDGEYQKTLPIVAIDIALNIPAIYYDDGADIDFDVAAGKHPQYIKSGDLKVMAGIITLCFELDNFKQVYADYKDGKVRFGAVRSAAERCGFDKLGIVNPYSDSVDNENIREMWYNYYVNTGVNIANEKATALAGNVTADLKEFINDYYKENSRESEALKAIADLPLVKNDLTNEEFEKYETAFANSTTNGIVLLVMLLVSLIG